MTVGKGLPRTVTNMRATVSGRMNGTIGVTLTSATPASDSASSTFSLLSYEWQGTSAPSRISSTGHTNAPLASSTDMRYVVSTRPAVSSRRRFLIRIAGHDSRESTRPRPSTETAGFTS